MKLEKAHWESANNRVTLHTPISKINEEKRTVSGFASLDNEDRQGDIVLKSASVEAFSEFRGNIREMHQPIAVGKMIDFTEDVFVDPASGDLYNGIWVTVRVSKGAQDTWEKVLDGTLSGFSIGGAVVEAESQMVKSDESKTGYKNINVIKKYRLTELSLVDSPANQFANVFSIAKADGVETATGMVADTKVENVFFCETDEIAKTADSEAATCLVCDTSMTVVGWIERDGASTVTKVADLINRFKGGVDNMTIKKNDEAVVEKDDSGVVTSESVNPQEEVVTEEPVVEETVVEEEVTTEDPAEEVETVDLEETLKALMDQVDALSKDDRAVEALVSIQKDLEEVRGEITTLKERDEALRNEFNDVKKGLSEVQGLVEKFDSGTALKKSVSHGDTAATEGSSSLWAGSPMSF